MSGENEARMTNPALVLGDAMKGIGSIMKATRKGGVAEELLELVALRASQINGCSPCVYGHVDRIEKVGGEVRKAFMVSAWRETDLFSEAERAALALAEAATRVADNAPGVTDEVWDAATKHFDEEGMSALLLSICVTNMFNRINGAISEQAGVTWG
ncbi:carboxymuconolactone decarboxylase family protein [Glycomyces sp. NPDC049804]|uniref:carboxymuconolactone decarboxylase family protein n=1 Tax=Glycomyces sp. NPDC049804 TaxID=3154363 RepID=UPI0034246510